MTNVAQQIGEHLGVNDALFRKQVRGESSWDELANGIEPNIRTQIANCAQLCRDTYQIVDEEGLVNPEFSVMTQGIMKDLQFYADDLNTLTSRRQGRTGQTKGPSDYTDYLSIGLEMTDLSKQLQEVVGHALIGLTDHHHAAIEKRRARLEAETITDVVEKQVTQESQPV